MKYFHDIDGSQQIEEITQKIKEILKKIMKNSQNLIHLFLTKA